MGINMTRQLRFCKLWLCYILAYIPFIYLIFEYFNINIFQNANNQKYIKFGAYSSVILALVSACLSYRLINLSNKSKVISIGALLGMLFAPILGYCVGWVHRLDPIVTDSGIPQAVVSGFVRNATLVALPFSSIFGACVGFIYWSKTTKTA